MIGSVCDYQAVIPDSLFDSGASLQAEARGDSLRPLLFGQTANVQITHVSPAPALLYSRIRLTPAAPEPAALRPTRGAVPSLSFDVDRQVTTNLRPGDVLSICRTGAGGIGLSVVRHDELVVAAGAVTSVPLGRDVSAVIPGTQMAEAGALLARVDPEFRWHEAPVAVTIRRHTRVLFRARIQIEGHEVFVVHGAVSGLPGIDACLSIARLDVCQPVAASATALLLARRILDEAGRAGMVDVV